MWYYINDAIKHRESTSPDNYFPPSRHRWHKKAQICCIEWLLYSIFTVVKLLKVHYFYYYQIFWCIRLSNYVSIITMFRGFNWYDINGAIYLVFCVSIRKYLIFDDVDSWCLISFYSIKYSICTSICLNRITDKNELQTFNVHITFISDTIASDLIPFKYNRHVVFAFVGVNLF